MNTLAMEEQVAVLLHLLGPEVAEPLLAGLPADRSSAVRRELKELDAAPPGRRAIDAVLDEFERFLRLASHHRRIDATDEQLADEDEDEDDEDEDSAAKPESEAEPTILKFQPSDDPFEDLARIPPKRIAGALRSEHPRTVALVLGCLPSEIVSDVLKRLPEAMRTEVFLQLNSKQKSPRQTLGRMVRATIEAAQALDMKQLDAENANREQRMAKMLRAMSRRERSTMLEALAGQDADAAERIKTQLYQFSDLLLCEDRSLQKLLSEVDSATLGTALKDADPALVEKTLANLSKRARESLLEEIELRRPPSAEERAEAESAIVHAMLVLDEAGELTMKS